MAMMLNSNRIVLIVQARMRSTRLPNKTMLWLHGLPIAGWVLHRVRQSREVDEIVFAIPNTQADDPLAIYLESNGALVYRGEEDDVLSRFINTARKYKADWIVRVCADNPFVAASEIDRLIEFFASGSFDYAFNNRPHDNAYPDGLGAEITKYETLEKIGFSAYTERHREHVFNYIWDNQSQFKIATFDPDERLNYPHLKLDLDTHFDYKRMLQISIRPDDTAYDVVNTAIHSGLFAP